MNVIQKKTGLVKLSENIQLQNDQDGLTAKFRLAQKLKYENTPPWCLKVKKIDFFYVTLNPTKNLTQVNPYAQQYAQIQNMRNLDRVYNRIQNITPEPPTSAKFSVQDTL